MRTARVGDDALVCLTSGKQCCPFCGFSLDVEVGEEEFEIIINTRTISRDMMEPFPLPCCKRMAWFQDDESTVLLPKDHSIILSILQKNNPSTGYPKLSQKWCVFVGYNTITKKRDYFARFRDVDGDFCIYYIYRWSGKLKTWQFHSYSSRDVGEELVSCGRFKNLKVIHPPLSSPVTRGIKKGILYIYNPTIGKFLKLKKEIWNFITREK